MAKGSIRAHRIAIMCATVVVVCLGWTPSQAFALDVPIDPTPVTTAVAPVVTAVTNTTPDPIDTVTNTVSNTVPNPVDTVSNTVSGTVPSTGPVDTVTNAASDTVSNTISDVATSAGAVQTTQASSITGTTSLSEASSTEGTAAGRSDLLRPMSKDDLALLAQRNQAPTSLGDDGHATCVAGVGTACQSLEGTGGSWTRSVADIIRKLLALTGMSALALFVLACCLTLAGAVALHQSRDRSELGSA